MFSFFITASNNTIIPPKFAVPGTETKKSMYGLSLLEISLKKWQSKLSSAMDIAIKLFIHIWLFTASNTTKLAQQNF